MSWQGPLRVASPAFIKVCSMEPWPQEMFYQEEMDYGLWIMTDEVEIAKELELEWSLKM